VPHLHMAHPCTTSLSPRKQPDNLLLKSRQSEAAVVIADFGFAARLTSAQRTLTRVCGTPE
jgi:serine/threonine protein kinase